MWPFARKHAPTISGPRAIPAPVAIKSALRRRPTQSHPHEMPPSRGMWVRYRDRTGILSNLSTEDIATVMLVDPERGENVLEINVPASDLRQAWFDEIPLDRRPNPAQAATMGYHRRPS